MRQAGGGGILATARGMALAVVSLTLAQSALAYNFTHFGGRLGRPGVDGFRYSWDEPDHGALTWFLDRNELTLADCDPACFTALKARIQPELDKWALWIRESFAEAPSLAQAEVQIRFIEFSTVVGAANANYLTYTGGTLDTALIRIDPDGLFAWNTPAGRDDFAFLILHEWGHVLGLGDLYRIDHNGPAAGGTFEGEDFCDHGLPGGALPDIRTKADNVMQTRGWSVLDNDEIHGAEWLWGSSGSNGIVTGELAARAAGFNANQAANHHGLSQTPNTWTYRGTVAAFTAAPRVTIFFRHALAARDAGPGTWNHTVFPDRVEFVASGPYEGNFKFEIDTGFSAPERLEDAIVAGAVSTDFTATPVGGRPQVFPFGQVYGAYQDHVNLALGKDDGGIAAGAGETIIYTLEISNLGNLDAAGVELTETVPANTTLNAAASDPGWSCAGSAAGSSCTLSVGQVVAGASPLTFAFAVDVVSPLGTRVGVIDNTAAVADDGSSGADPNLSNNSASDSTPLQITLINHFTCYPARLRDFTRVDGVGLDDRFGRGTVSLRKVTQFCNPANKEGQDPAALADPDHLIGYQIRQSTPRFSRIRDVKVDNQFGRFVMDIGPVKTLWSPAAKSLTGTPPPLAAPAVDHFKCYRARRVRFNRPGLRVEDQFGTLDVEVGSPRLFCSPADKNGGGILEPDAHLLCFKARSRPRKPPRDDTVFSRDQFLDAELSLRRLESLCVPSVIVP